MSKSEHDSEGADRPSEDEVWRDLVSRLESTENQPENSVDTGTPGPHGAARHDPDPKLFEYPSPGPAPSPEQDRDRDRDRDNLGGPRDYAPAEEDPGFVPEDPPSLAGAEPLVVLAWCAAIGGPLFLLLSAFFFRGMPMIAVLGTVAAFICSVVFLLMRLPRDRDEDSDDGAVV